MFLKTKSLTGRLFSFSLTLIFINLLVAFTFFTFVANHHYRKQDQKVLKAYAKDFAHALENEAFHASYREEFLWIQIIENGKVIYQQFPRDMKKDERDIIQGHAYVSSGHQTIDISLNDPGEGIVERFEDQLGQFLVDRGFYTLGSFWSDDFFDIFVLPTSKSKVIRVGKSAEDREEMIQDLRTLMAWSFLPALLLGLILSYFMGRYFMLPIREVMSSLKIGRVKLNEEKAPREMIELKDEFNAVLDKNRKLLESTKSTLDNIAHDLKTPLTHLKINSERGILQDQDVESLKERLGANMEAADTILSIVGSLMDVKEAESGALFLKQKEIDLADLIERVVDMHSLHAQDRNIKFNLSLSSLKVMGDETRLFQVFSNLLDNATKFSPDNSEIQVNLLKAGKWAEVQVIDQGAGIDSTEQEFIWDRLYRGDKSRYTQGFGIGLSLVKAYTDAHKGVVGVESRPGQGSKFFVKLPICHAEDKDL
jgi:signal transduction histidine kinase